MAYTAQQHTDVNGAQTASDKISYVYDRRILKEVKWKLYFDRYGEKRVIPANSNTNKAFAIRYKQMQPATVPLGEYNGVRRTGNKIVREEIEYEVDHYGDFVEYTDRDALYNLRSDVAKDYARIVANQASLTVDMVHRNKLSSSTNVTFADGATDKDEVASGQKRFTDEDFRMMGIKFTRQLAEKFYPRMDASTKVSTGGIRAAYIGLVHTSVAEDILDLPESRGVTEYAQSANVPENEVCSIRKFRIFEIPNVRIEDIDGTNVYTSYFFGKNAYSTVTISKKGGIQTIIKNIDDKDKFDALNEFGLIGWKAIAGAVITNTAWFINGFSTASVEDDSELHFMDND